MYIIITTLIIVVIGFIIMTLPFKKNKANFYGYVITICGLITFFCETLVIISIHEPNYKEKIKNSYNNRYIVLTELLEEENNWRANKNLYKQIYIYNSEVKLAKYYYENKWTNWFVCPSVVQSMIIDSSEK